MFDEFGFPMLPLGAFEPRGDGRMRLHGGKSSSAPAPDPRLVEAQVRSLDNQTAMAERVVSQSEALAPLQREQLQFGLDSARTAFDQSQEDRAYMLDRRGLLTQQQNQMVDDAADFNSDARRQELRGQAYADTNAAFSSANDQAMRGLQRRGVNPNSGRALAMSSNNSIAQASALASASAKVNQAARAEGYALTDRAANALAGYPAMGMQATQAGAGYGTAGVGLANQGLQGLTSGYGAAGSMYGNVASGASNAYNSQANAYAAGMPTDNTGAILGSVAGITAAFMMSDPDAKEDVEKVGKDKRTGLNLYEFGYKGDRSDKRYQGVMADEVRKKYPKAVKRGKDGFDRVNYKQLGLRMKEVH